MSADLHLICPTIRCAVQRWGAKRCLQGSGHPSPAGLTRDSRALCKCPHLSHKNALCGLVNPGCQRQARREGGMHGREEAACSAPLLSICHLVTWCHWVPKSMAWGSGQGNLHCHLRYTRILLGWCKHGVTRYLCGLWIWYKSLCISTDAVGGCSV